MAQQIRFLYQELRQPKHNLTPQELGQIVTRTFDALDNQGTTTVNSTTVVNQIVSGLWTQTGSFLYPTVTPTTLVLIGTTSSDFFFSPGQLGTTAAIGMMSAPTNAAVVYLFISPGIETQLVSNSSGTGTLLPLSFYCGGLRASISTAGTFYVGTRTSDLTLSGGEVVSTTAFIVISASTNSSLFDITIFGGLCEIISSHSGTGTTLPIAFLFGASEAARFKTDRSLLIGLTSTDFGTTAGMIVITSSYVLVSNTTNASTFSLHMGSQIQNISSSTGTGTVLPITWLMASTEIARFKTAGSFLIGLVATDITDALGTVVASTLFAVASATANATTIAIQLNGTTETILQSGATGTGTLLPLSLYTNNTRRLTVDTTGTVILGGSVTAAAAANGRLITTGDLVVVTAQSGALSYFQAAITAGTEVTLVSAALNAGTNLPISFYTAGSRRVTITTSGILICGALSIDFGGAGDIAAFGGVSSFSATTNASICRIIVNGGLAQLQSTASGTGTVLPLIFSVGGTEEGRFDTAGSLFLGLTSSDVGSITGRLIASNRLYVVSAATNASTLFMGMTAGTETFLSSNATGTGTQLPLSLFVNTQRRWTIGTSGGLNGGFNSTTFGDFGDAAGEIIAAGQILTASALINASYMRMVINGTTETILQSASTGTGTALPLSFYSSSTRVATLLSTPRFLINRNTDDGTGAVLQVSGNISVNGTVLTVP